MAAERKRGSAIRVALVCQSNVNRSMESHDVLRQNGYEPCSFGVGRNVKLPGATQNSPNIYKWGTPYTSILADLRHKDARRYQANGMLNMLERDARVKKSPERWQDSIKEFDIIVTYERRVYNIVVEEFQRRQTARTSAATHPAYVVNLDTKDSHQGAEACAQLTLKLITKLDQADDWEENLSDLFRNFEEQNQEAPMLHSIQFY